MDGAIGRKEQVRGRCSWRSTDSKLFSQCSASLLSRVLGAKWGYESHRWDGLSDPGIRLCRLPTLVPFSSTNLHPGTGLPLPLARKSRLVGTRAGAEIKLGPEPEPEPEPGQGQGQWLMSLSSKEMANPRAGSKPKAHSMAMLVTIPVARVSTLAHSTRGSKVLGSSQLYWLYPGSPLAT